MSTVASSMLRHTVMKELLRKTVREESHVAT